MVRDKWFTRRAFLKGASTAAFGVPLVVRSSALGAAEGTSPSERIGLGFIECVKLGSEWRIDTVE